MNDPTRSYKYSCRKCPIRLRCINDKSFGPGLKMAIARRFDNRTDTFETWDMLQEDCLLIRREEQEAAKRAAGQSGLVKRLRQTQKGAAIPPAAETEISAPPAAEKGVETLLQEIPWPTPREPVTAQSPRPSLPATPCGLTISATERLVRLADDGPIIIGRFEHGFTDPPDLDLTFADGEFPSVSRRHARVTGVDQRHWIEDLGASNGTYVNGRQLPLGEKLPLSPGDRILLGMCRLVYTPLPAWMLKADGRTPHLTFLIITHTGHRLDLPDRSELLIGRPDPSLGYEPDADISVAGEIGMYVSRRHARLLQRGGWHFLQEMGSASGTRINGKPIQPGESPMRLNPGDQLWLGGCVVAYEWELL